MSSVDSLTSQLKRAGLRITPQRTAICRYLIESDLHPTAADIYDSVRTLFPSISLMTVYNTLNMLVEMGAVNVLGHAGDDTVHYDADIEPHVNLACISCHKILDIPSDYVIRMNDEIGQNSGFQILGARVLYYGLCPTCKATVSAPAKKKEVREE